MNGNCLRVVRVTSNMEGWKAAVVPAFTVWCLLEFGGESLKAGDRLSALLCGKHCTIGSSITGRACPRGSLLDFSCCRLGVWRVFAFA